MALQKSFTGIDNEGPERIAAYKGQEQQVIKRYHKVFPPDRATG